MRVILLALYLFLNFIHIKAEDKDELAGKIFIEKIDRVTAQLKNKATLADWDYQSNITDANLAKQLEANAEFAKKFKEIWAELITYPWKTYKDERLKRQFKKYSVIGTSALPADKFEKFSKIVADMQTIYAKGKICSYNDTSKCDLALEPEITEIMAQSRNPDELKHTWVEWRKVSGQKVKDLYKEYVVLSNEAAKLNNFNNNAEYWQDDFEDPNFTQDIEQLLLQLRPLYAQLHAYVRRQLSIKYGEDVVSRKGSIPAHLLGNMWAQTWSNIYDFTQPFPNDDVEDASKEMVKQGYTPLKMFKMAEDFFTSLNLSAMPPIFWEKSIIEKPNDGRELVCHASAWDFYDGQDFRIKQCTRVNLEDFETVHHEMGHIQYFLQYKHQPDIFKTGANSGFHEAVGDVMSLSVSTPKHLHTIGLVKDVKNSKEATINQLYKVALDKIAFLPFGYIMDQWRWNAFQGKIIPENYNYEWWKLRETYQGVKAPVERSENDFDIGAKYHTVADVPYIRYFVSFVIQFQFHRTLCEKAGQYEPNNPEKPLHNCDIYKSIEAGKALGEMLQLGNSKPWQDAMEVLTGQRNMDAGALLEYFKPLQEYLEEENKKTGEHIGWESDMSIYKH